MSQFRTLRPTTVAEHHQAQALLHNGHVVHVGGHYIGADLCTTKQQRAHIVSMAHPGSLAVNTTALWIYTGSVAGVAAEKFDTHPVSETFYERKQYFRSDIIKVGGIEVTTPERTIIDLLLNDLEQGVDATLILLAHGADLDRARRRSYTLRSLHHLRPVRDVLDQLTFARESSERFDPVTR